MKRLPGEKEAGHEFRRDVSSFVKRDGVALGAAIKLVAHDRMPDGIKMYADLVLAARSRPALKQRKTFRHRFDPGEFRPARLAAVLFGGHDHFHRDTRGRSGALHRKIHREFLLRDAMDDREICLFGRALRKLFDKRRADFAGFGEHKHPACLAVDPVRQKIILFRPERRAVPLCLEMHKQGVEEKSSGGMNGQVRGFFNDKQRVVFVQDFVIEIDFGLGFAFRKKPDFVARDKLCAGFEPADS